MTWQIVAAFVSGFTFATVLLGLLFKVASEVIDQAIVEKDDATNG